MDRADVAPLVGILGAVGVVAVLAYPFLTAESSGADLYYSSGAVNPLLAGLFALVSIIVFAAGREDRTDPVLAAGVTLVFGLFVVLIAAAWATTMRIDVITISPDHRWVLVGVGLLLPLSSAWWARTLGVF